MKIDKKQYLVPSLAGLAFMLIISVGCNSPQEYKYQKTTEAVDVHAVTSEEVKALAAKEAQPEAAKTEPAVPNVTVGELLQSGKTHDSRRIVVSGRKGKLLPHYNMAYLINVSDDKYIAFSYDRMPGQDLDTLRRYNSLQKVSVTGVWDSSKNVLIGEGVKGN